MSIEKLFSCSKKYRISFRRSFPIVSRKNSIQPGFARHLNCKNVQMIRILRLLFGLIPCSIRSRQDLLLKILALRQQLATLKTKCPKTKLHSADKVFWVVLRRFWTGWKRALVLVQPETVVGWHRAAGFRLYWNRLSRKRTRVGRKVTSKALRDLIFRIGR